MMDKHVDVSFEQSVTIDFGMTSDVKQHMCTSEITHCWRIMEF